MPLLKKRRGPARGRGATGEIIDGKKIAAEVRSEVAEAVQNMRSSSIEPGLAVVLVGQDPASVLYVANKERACAEVGIRTETFRVAESVSQGGLLSLVERINGDSRFHGILVQLPLPSHIDANRIAWAISAEKDVDGVHPSSAGRLARGEPFFVPPTPLGIQELLRRRAIPVEGRHVVVCGRSTLVGRPVALLLMQKASGANATVTVCHTGTLDLAAFTRQADILVTAIGRARSITADMVKEGVVVVDVGINRVEDPATPRGYRFVGDVDFEAVQDVASAITPVPGGVGPMTVAMLLRNTVLAARRAFEAA